MNFLIFMKIIMYNNIFMYRRFFHKLFFLRIYIINNLWLKTFERELNYIN